MSAITVKAALIDEIDGITGVGLVEGRYGRQEGLPWEDETTDGINALCVVTWIRHDLDPEMPDAIGAKFYQHTYMLQVFLPRNFEADSESRFDSLLEAILAQLRPDPALSVCAATASPRLASNDYVIYGALRGEILCHKGVIEFKATEYATD